jgi:eukaryotic-like serine/threonine-protein kinase
MPLRTVEDLRQGDVLAGKYRIERVIGVGGMGVVVAAQHLELGTLVAVKLLLSEGSGADEAIERFAREARAASRLRGEHAIHVYDVGKHSDGTPFMVMEYLVGQDLGTLLSVRGTFDARMAVGCVLQACQAVAEAHSIGIVHRDLKPRNMFLTQRIDGSPLVKVLDFGIAKRVESEADSSLTGPLMVGSPCYMSPEQMRAFATVDTRSDIWSLGICVYELVTGLLPFGGDSPLETCAIVMRDHPVSPAELRPDVPSKLSQVVMRCLHKDPAERFQDVGELAEALEPFAPPSDRGAALRVRQVLRKLGGVNASLSVPALVAGDVRRKPVAPESTRLRRRWWSRIAVATMLGLVAVAVFWIGPRTSAPKAKQQEPLPTAGASVEASTAVIFTSVPLAASPPTVTWESIAPTSRATKTKRARPIQAQAADLPSPPMDPPKANDLENSVRPTIPSVAVPAPAAPPPPIPVAATPRSPDSTPTPFVVESARVQIGAPAGVVGTTATNIGRALAKVAPQMTACYRAALPRMSAPFEGTGTLHLETNEEGVIVGAQFVGPLAAAVGSCIAASARGRLIPSVDTGRARGDVPLVFTPR